MSVSIPTAKVAFETTNVLRELDLKQRRDAMIANFVTADENPKAYEHLPFEEQEAKAKALAERARAEQAMKKVIQPQLDKALWSIGEATRSTEYSAVVPVTARGTCEERAAVLKNVRKELVSKNYGTRSIYQDYFSPLEVKAALDSEVGSRTVNVSLNWARSNAEPVFEMVDLSCAPAAAEKPRPFTQGLEQAGPLPQAGALPFAQELEQAQLLAPAGAASKK